MEDLTCGGRGVKQAGKGGGERETRKRRILAVHRHHAVAVAEQPRTRCTQLCGPPVQPRDEVRVGLVLQ
eukprot:361071-Chlamydomonas_euryale.AAC.3